VFNACIGRKLAHLCALTKLGTNAAHVPIFHRDRRPHRSHPYKERKGGQPRGPDACLKQAEDALAMR
jgi:hypothetical protein